MKSYTVQGKSEKFETLILDAEAAMPQVADNQVLVRVKAISLNYRDIVVAKGTYPFGFNHGVVPCSDGAGHVVEVGKSVTRFAVGDNVITTFYSKFIGGDFTMDHIDSAIGATADGTLREYGAFDENALVPMPAHLTFEEASTLTCVGVTAWNALYGIPTKAIKAGDVVLIQGTGGVSIFALQLAKAAGCTVIATTSTDEKAQVLRSLGADHIINYKRNSDWGVKAKEIVPQGVDHVLEVGGPKTMAQSLQAIRPDGVITIIGFVGGEHNGDQPTFLDVLQHACVVRGILVGSRVHFEELIKAVEAHKLKPVVDKKRFTLQEAPDAFQYLYDQKHIGKLCISVE